MASTPGRSAFISDPTKALITRQRAPLLGLLAFLALLPPEPHRHQELGQGLERLVRSLGVVGAEPDLEPGGEILLLWGHTPSIGTRGTGPAFGPNAS